MQGFEDSSGPPQSWRTNNVKKLQRVRCLSKAYELCSGICRTTATFPREERYGLNSQIRRSALSIPSNVAEGYCKKTTFDYIRILYICCSSVCELRTQILLAGDLGFSVLGIVTKDMVKGERTPRVLIKSSENEPLTP
jgi:four helix bundle protein